MADRFSQMSEQAALIARKKAEVEAKRLAALDEAKSGSSSSSSASSKPSPSSLNKNKWGFKGKMPGYNKQQPQQQQQHSSPKPPAPPVPAAKTSLPNNFNNDGSFLEQFKRMQEAKAQQDQPQKHPVVLPVKATLFVNSKSEPFLLSTIPKDHVPDPIVAVEKPPEADAWFKSALEKARAIAQTIKQEPSGQPPPPPQHQPEQEIKPKTEPVNPSSSEYGGSSTSTAGPSKVKTEVISQPEAADSKVASDYTDMVKREELPSCFTDIDDDKEPLPIVVQELASMVALSGDGLEEIARARNVGEEQLAFLQDVDCELYKRYRVSVESMRRGMDAERLRNREEQGKPEKERKKSRWSDEKVPLDPVTMIPVGVLPVGMGPSASSSTIPPGASPQLIQYAMRVFGSTDLTNDQWRQCEDQIKMTVVYNQMLHKKQQLDLLAQQGKRKYEYDSDEDVDGGTWEHKQRRLEMEKTAREAEKLTEAGKGRHHIGDFLPPEELSKFMAKFQALQRGEDYDESDYSENKLTEDNLGFKMLQRMGWSEGSGLGTEAQGITAPIQKGNVNSDKKGLGVNVPHELDREDDEFEAYRKRMMLAYRFRPNPLNNPRRAYY